MGPCVCLNFTFVFVFIIFPNPILFRFLYNRYVCIYVKKERMGVQLFVVGGGGEMERDGKVRDGKGRTGCEKKERKRK